MKALRRFLHRKIDQLPHVVELRTRVSELSDRATAFEDETRTSLAEARALLAALSDRIARLETIPAQITALQSRLDEVPGRIAQVEEAFRTDTAALQSRDWAQSTMLANFRDRLLELEDKLVRGDPEAARARRQRTRDLEDYIKLGGGKPPA